MVAGAAGEGAAAAAGAAWEGAAAVVAGAACLGCVVEVAEAAVVVERADMSRLAKLKPGCRLEAGTW